VINWHGLAAIILALGVSVTVVLLGVETLTHDGHVSPEEATLLATVLGAGVGAIATYLGLAERDDQSDHGAN
jgi:hypothetical protein